MKTRTKTILEFTGLSLIVLAFAMFVLQYAEATQALTISDIYNNSIVLYEGESITITNDQSTPHSMTSVDNLFNSGSLSSGASFKLALPNEGIYQFYDAATNQTGSIQMIYASLSVTPSTATAGDLIAIDGVNFSKANKQTNFIITKPDGSTYQDLTVVYTSKGQIHLPLQTTRNDQNGIYTVKAIGYERAIATFSLSGGYDANNPLVVTPTITTNSTQTNSTSQEPITQDAPIETPIETPSTDTTSTTVTISTNSTFTAEEKQTLIALLQKLIDLLNKSK